MRKIFLTIFLLSFSLFSEELIDLTPKVDYRKSQRYSDNLPPNNQEIKKSDKKSKYDVSVDIDINKEEKTLDKLKLDMKTDFKGID